MSALCLGSQKGQHTLRCIRSSAATGQEEGLSHSALDCVASPGVLYVGLRSQYMNDVKLLENVQGRAMKMLKSQEGRSMRND